jgi:hypothetical protein
MKFYNLKNVDFQVNSVFSLNHISETCGSCSYGGCSCSSFSMKDNDPQWCANCGHSRRYHVNG